MHFGTVGAYYVRLVLTANGLVKRDPFSLSNPFAVIKTDGSDLRPTTVFKKALTPYWNETFDLFCVTLSPFFCPSLNHSLIFPQHYSRIVQNTKSGL